MSRWPPTCLRPVALSLGWAWKEGALLPSWVWMDSPLTATSPHRSSGGLKGPETIGSCPLRARGWCHSTGSLDLPQSGFPSGFLDGSVFWPLHCLPGTLPQAPISSSPSVSSQPTLRSRPASLATHSSLACIFCVQTKVHYHFRRKKKSQTNLP